MILRRGEGETGKGGDKGTRGGGETRSLLVISSSSHSMGINCASPPVSLPLPPLVSPPPCPLVSLSFLSVNVEFLRVALDRRAGFARQREDVVAAIFGRHVDLLEQLDDRRVR